MSDKKLTSRTTELPVDSITIASSNCRTNFDEQLLFDLGSSMETNTQLSPIIINRIGDKNILVAGERRLKAAQKTGKQFIEAKVFEDLEPIEALRMSLAENRDRVELNAIEQARGMQLLFEHGFNENRIATEYGFTVDTVKKRLKLLKLPEDVQRLITRDKNSLPVHQALQLVNLSTSDAIRIARQAAPITGKVASESEVKKMIDDSVGQKLPMPEQVESVCSLHKKEKEKKSTTKLSSKKSKDLLSHRAIKHMRQYAARTITGEFEIKEGMDVVNVIPAIISEVIIVPKRGKIIKIKELKIGIYSTETSDPEKEKIIEKIKKAQQKQKTKKKITKRKTSKKKAARDDKKNKGKKVKK